MNEYRRNEVVSGAFVTLAIVLFGALAFRVVGLDALGLGGTREVEYVTYMQNTGGLESGAPVRVAGIAMGIVQSIELTQDQRDADWVTEARIAFVITHPDIRINPQTAWTRISNTGLLGTSFLDLHPGSQTPGQLQTPASESAKSGIPPSGSSDHPIVIRGVDAPTIASVVTDFGPVLADARQLIASLDTLITENDPLLRTALTDLTRTSSDMRDAIDSLATRVDEVLGTMNNTVEENRTHLTKLLEDLAQTSKVAREKIAEVGDDAQRLLNLGNNLLETNGPQVSETMRRLRRTMWEAEIAMRKVRANPAVLLFGDDEKMYDPSDYDKTWLRNTGRAGPYEQRDE